VDDRMIDTERQQYRYVYNTTKRINKPFLLTYHSDVCLFKIPQKSYTTMAQS